MSSNCTGQQLIFFRKHARDADAAAAAVIIGDDDDVGGWRALADRRRVSGLFLMDFNERTGVQQCISCIVPLFVVVAGFCCGGWSERCCCCCCYHLRFSCEIFTSAVRFPILCVLGGNVKQICLYF